MEISKTTLKVRLGSAKDGNLLLIYLNCDADGVPERVDRITIQEGGHEGMQMLTLEDFERVGKALRALREQAQGVVNADCLCMDHGYYESGESYRCPKCDAELEARKAARENGVHPVLTAPEISDAPSSDDNDTKDEPDALLGF